MGDIELYLTGSEQDSEKRYDITKKEFIDLMACCFKETLDKYIEEQRSLNDELFKQNIENNNVKED